MHRGCFLLSIAAIAMSGYGNGLLTNQRTPAVTGGVFGAYPTYHDVDSTVHLMQTRYPGIVNVRSLSEKSYQGRDIFIVRVSSTPLDTQNLRPEALVSGVQHGDEPIGAYMCLADLAFFCANYGKDPEVTWLVDNRQIYFIPVMNPDRYVWNERFAGANYASRRRKTMHCIGTTDSALGGVDPNRNYPYKFAYDNTGSSGTATASNYRGPSALSEPETRAVVNFITAQKVRTWQNYHNSGDYLIIPYGYRGATSPKYPADSSVYFAICTEQKKRYRYVKTGNSADCYGSWFVNGGTDDWGTADSLQYGKNYKVYCVIPEIGADPNNYWPFWNDAAVLKRKCDSLTSCDLYMIQCAGFFPVLKELKVFDDAPGNANGILDPGETAKLVARIENKSVVDTTPDVRAALATSSASCGVIDSAGGFGAVRFLSEAQNTADPFTVSCRTTALPGDIIRFNLNVRWRMNGIDFVKSLPCSLRVGAGTGVISIGIGARTGGRMTVSFQRDGKLRVTLPSLTRDFAAAGGNRAMVRIYDAAGRLVASAGYDIAKTAGPVVWEVPFEAGVPMKSGMYCVRVYMNDRFLGSERIVYLKSAK